MCYLLREESLICIRPDSQSVSKNCNLYCKTLKAKLILIHFHLKHRYYAMKKLLGLEENVTKDATTCRVSVSRRLKSLL